MDYQGTINLLLQRFPEFHEAWQQQLEYWKDKKRSVGIDIMAFCSFISDKLEINESYEYQKVFDFIEYLLEIGNDSVQTAATTMFLENLVNTSSHGTYPRERFDHFMGPKSREYCAAWDEFCGVSYYDSKK